MARVQVWEPRLTRWDHDVPVNDEEQDCPACRGRGDEDCLTCGGEGYV